MESARQTDVNIEQIVCWGLRQENGGKTREDTKDEVKNGKYCAVSNQRYAADDDDDRSLEEQAIRPIISRPDSYWKECAHQRRQADIGASQKNSSLLLSSGSS